MAKRLSLKSGLSSLLFWSIIAAAFIGPGTVTTAAKSGAAFQLDLLWALVFSILATILLQEAAARITIGSGKSLGALIAQKYGQGSAQWLKWLLFIAVALGCAAYEAGNILGAVSGILLLGNIEKWIIITLIAAFAVSLLWLGKYRQIANFMGIVVALMGATFLYVAFSLDYTTADIARATFFPRWNPDASLLVIGLIGTTIVPYNLFLASGISKGQDLKEMRIGLILAILIGGMISMAILIVGAEITGTFSFETLSMALSTRLGGWAAGIFSYGLFAAGLTSSITAPLAAAATAQSLFGADRASWNNQSLNFRAVWGSILAVGVVFSLTSIQAIPAIIAAQALNGILLPVVAIFLILTMNDSELLPKKYLNGPLINILMLLVLFICSFLGINNLMKAIQRLGLFDETISNTLYSINLALSALILLWVAWNIFVKRKKPISID